ncbi:MAG TPA: universal stress protein [Bryobacteraceae bacterium]|nr:universal stress protein [Bryobacteraceae bacterium]
MLQIARILVPVDFSERCLKMMPYVRLFAEKYRSELILLHVMNPVYTIPDTALSGPIPLPLPERAFEHGAERLDGFALAELQGLPVRRLLYEGDPETQIAETAQTEDVQLLMMPTRGHGAFRTFLLGSITSKVLHDVARPIVTGVHVSEHSVSSISTVVYAGDSGDQTADVLAWADGLAIDFQAKLVHAEPRLDPEAVCAFAESSGADLLVIARGSRPSAYAIIRQSPCPVLSI